jgi:hypothetical protein
MSIFNTILQKLGLQKPAAPAAPAAPAKGTAPAASNQMAPNRPGQMMSSSTAAVSYVAPVSPAPMQMVDVVSKLDQLAKANPEKLDWKVSIVDLLKLLGMEATGPAIKELAVELGCPGSEMADSYKRNVWTHKALLNKIAQNGGNIPQNLLH